MHASCLATIMMVVTRQLVFLHQIRAAILEEIRLAAEVLVGSNHFTSSIAQAVSCHIYSYIELENPEDFEGHVFLDHARLLGVEPLRALLEFLWLQLGLRWSSLHWVIQADNLIGVRPAFWCCAVCLFPAHSLSCYQVVHCISRVLQVNLCNILLGLSSHGKLHADAIHLLSIAMP